MGKEKGSSIFLIGFSYSGKSVVGRKIAARLGWDFVDIDDEIVAITGKSIPHIFEQDGEQHFRELERQVLQQVCRRRNVVVATGGGIITDGRNRELMARSGVVICLEARPETIYRRLQEQDNGDLSGVRPLLADKDPLRRIELLKTSRQHYYDMADWIIHTDDMSIEEVCEEVVQNHNRRKGGVSPAQFEGAICVVEAASGSYPVFVGWDSLGELGKRMRQVGLGGKVAIISDETVFPHHGDRVRAFLEGDRFTVHSIVLPPGEATKTIDNVVKIYDFLVERHFERGDTVVALGGGVVGDLAGFVAATFLRGVPLVQVPTSLVAMVDASIGGKTAVNHPRGKNLIGAFYQPRLVFADVRTLLTLPERELTSGWAEVIKHAMILDAQLLEFLEEHSGKLVALEAGAASKVIEWSAELKADVVQEDEREMGQRIILNYGHTIAHGLEAATGYRRFLHGEAVAIGMMGAAALSERLGILSGEVAQRQRAIISAFGLPTSCSGVSLDGVVAAMELDKKMRGERVRWVLLQDIGYPVVRDDVPRDMVLGVLGDLLKDDS